MPITDPFDRYSAGYDEWFETHAGLYEDELAAVRRLMPETVLRSVEIGAGTGRFALPLGIRLGVEPSAPMADKARKRGLAVSRGCAEHLPLKTGVFDAALFVTTICFVDDIEACFSEVSRILKQGGVCVSGFIDRNSSLGRKYREKRNRSRFYKDAVFYSADEVVHYMNKAGLTVTGSCQALLPGEAPGCIRDGYGKGSFVVIRGTRQ